MIFPPRRSTTGSCSHGQQLNAQEVTSREHELTGNHSRRV